jgi:hypothetical protein
MKLSLDLVFETVIAFGLCATTPNQVQMHVNFHINGNVTQTATTSLWIFYDCAFAMRLLILRSVSNMLNEIGWGNLQIKERELARGDTITVHEAACQIASKDGTQVVIRNLRFISNRHI